MADLLQMIRTNKMLQLVLLAAGAFLIYKYMQQREAPESLENVDQDAKVEPQQLAQQDEPAAVAAFEEQQISEIVAGKAQLTADDLLPKYDDANEFAKQNPVSNLLKEQNFLVSGHHIGINTVMQSNKIPYHDLRSMPPIAKENVGPWAQSSYEQSPAQSRRFFEIGQ